MSLGNPGQRPVVMRLTRAQSDGPHDEPLIREVEVEPHLREHGRRRLEVERVRADDLDVTPGDGADDGPGRRLDVVAAQRVRRAAQRRAGPRCESWTCRCPRPGAHGREELASVPSTCGSHAALRISVTPVAAAAPSSAVSVPVTDASSRYTDAPVSPSGASTTCPAASSVTVAPMAPSARRCVVMVRRAGKSPPGAASAAARSGRRAIRAAAPTRASRPTSLGSGSDDRMSRHVIRSVGVPSPSTSAPSDRRRSSMTPTSRICGTLRSSQVSGVSRHAASSGSAAFLLPPTVTDPARRRPPRMTRFDIRELPQHHDLVPQVHAETRRARPRAPRSMSARISAAVARPSFDEEIRVRRRDARAADPKALQPRAIDQGAGRGRHVPRAAGRGRDPDSERCSRRSACRAAACACDAPARHAPLARNDVRLARTDVELGPDRNLARPLQPARVVAELHLAAATTLAHAAIALHDHHAR